RSWLLPRTLTLASAIVGLSTGFCAARDHLDGFEDQKTSWTIFYDKSAARVARHIRAGDVMREGRLAELVDVETVAAITAWKLSYQLPPALLIEDLKLSLWLKSNQDGATLAVRVVFPYQADPATGTSLAVLLNGDKYTKPGQWQNLECKDLKKGLTRLLPQI